MTTETVYQIGDILHGSWGYDQTNCEYYQVIGLTPKGYVLREIGQATVPSARTASDMSAMVMPVKDKFLENSEPVKARINKWGFLSVPVRRGAKTRVHLSKYEGGSNYSSWYA